MRHRVDSKSTLEQCLLALLPDTSRRTRKQMLENRRILHNGRLVTDPRTTLAVGDILEIGGKQARPKLPPRLRILHEDRDLIVVEKGHGLLSMATSSERENTAYALLSEHVKRSHPRNKVFIVHRLDRLASGLLVFAKSQDAKWALQEQFAAHSAERSYLAVVEGSPEPSEGVIELALLETEALKVRVARPGEDGKAARTHYRTLEAGRSRSTLEVRLETGRKHQIRVHLAAIGHPIVGDELYGSKRSDLGRLGLHARTLGFLHPRTGTKLLFDSPVPRKFRRNPALRAGDTSEPQVEPRRSTHGGSQR